MGNKNSGPREAHPIEKIVTHSMPSGNCRVWTGWRRNGYGMIQIIIDGKMKHRNAHRWLYEYIHGKVPKSLDIDHLCSNRSCINLDHLEPVTRSENVQRTYDRGLRKMIANGKYAKRGGLK